ncbi:pimeloyl-ACP methyl ester carboxylesterase [Pseudacidovorax intermedius]|uniref:Pimeloyl-ACP methyl ester carboxylesterase n=2 Tax=Pseudacidovorax intermedius TaxID=433924 RepID=A0A370FE01_9BURK|nr:pimeloyl-ACP methyl ester carboxylesterase [Pseudacidovorax intermedius]
MTEAADAMQTPARPVLLLIPGLLCDEAVWQAQVQALAPVADCVVARHGMADTIEGMARQALALLPPGAHFSVAGHSMGGRCALEIWRQVPERVQRLALLDTGYQARPAGATGEAEAAQRMALLALARAEGMRAMGRQWACGMVHPARWDSPVFAQILDMIERFTPAQFEAQIRALLHRPEATDLLARITAPTLLLCGREDGWSPLSRHEEMQRHIPQAQLVAVEDCGHMSTMEQPEAVTAALQRWLDERPSQIQSRPK